MTDLKALPEQSPEQFVYRRVSPTSWDRRKHLLEPTAFKRRRTESGLSVYCADHQTPRGVLQLCLDDQERRLRSSDPDERTRAESFFEQYGSTVESMVAAGWRVALVPIAAFIRRGFVPDAPDELGHQNVHGSYEDFARYSRELRGEARLLTDQECLADS